MDGVVTTSARRVRHAIRAVLAVVVLVTLALSIDFVATRDHSARGAVIGGISAGNRDAGGLDPVIEELAQRSTQPVVLRTPEGSAEVAPAELGLSFDADETRARLLEQPRNPITRFLALFGRGLDVEPVVKLDPAAMNKALDAHRRSLEKAAVYIAAAPKSNGSLRKRLPVNLNNALAKAGASGGNPGSPMPVGASVDGTMWTSITGMSVMRATL